MAKASAQALTLLVNDRVIVDRGLAHAVKQGFGGMLKPKQYPTGVISITMPPALQTSKLRRPHLSTCEN